MCRRQFLQQQSSSQTAEALARAEASAQVVINHVREVGRLMHRRNESLGITDGVLEAHLPNAFIRDDSVEDDGDEPPQNSGMYS
jgi:hypothetical protein